MIDLKAIVRESRQRREFEASSNDGSNENRPSSMVRTTIGIEPSNSGGDLGVNDKILKENSEFERPKKSDENSKVFELHGSRSVRTEVRRTDVLENTPRKACTDCGSQLFWRYAYVWHCWCCVPRGRQEANDLWSISYRYPAWLEDDRYWIDGVLPPTPIDAPRVRCSDCRHFERDQLGDGSGIGQCCAGVGDSQAAALWPNSERRCDAFTLKGSR